MFLQRVGDKIHNSPRKLNDSMLPKWASSFVTSLTFDQTRGCFRTTRFFAGQVWDIFLRFLLFILICYLSKLSANLSWTCSAEEIQQALNWHAFFSYPSNVTEVISCVKHSKSKPWVSADIRSYISLVYEMSYQIGKDLPGYLQVVLLIFLQIL